MKKLISYLLPVTCYLLLAVAPASAQEDDAVFDPETGQVMYYLSEDEMVGVGDTLDEEEMVEEVDFEALEEEEGFLPSPTSPFYFLQQLRERWEDITANTPEKKAEVALKQARRRLLEMRKLSLEEQGEQVESQFGKLQERYEEKMGKAEEKAEQAGEKMGEVKQKILEKREEQAQVLQGVLEKAPEQAQSALQRVIQRHEKNTERFINRWEERKGRVGERLEKVQERIENRFEEQQGALEKKGGMLEGVKERVEQRLEQQPQAEPTETKATPLPNVETFKQRVGRPQNVVPLKPSIAQPRPSPSVEQGKKVLGVFDQKTLWERIWEMVEEMIL